MPQDNFIDQQYDFPQFANFNKKFNADSVFLDL